MQLTARLATSMQCLIRGPVLSGDCASRGAGRILQFDSNERRTMKTLMTSHVRNFALGSAVVLMATFAVPTLSFAQSQDDSSQSVAEAARKAKERKKTAPKENHVITDDTLKLRPASSDFNGAPPAGTVINTTPTVAAGDSAAASTEGATAAKPADSSTAVADQKKKTEAAAAAAKTKELLAQAQTQLDILKRELALDSDSFFSNPDYAHDAKGKAKLDDLKRLIGDKQTSVEELKRQLTELAEKAGIPLDDAKPAAPPQR